ncbi:Endochitinase [Lachnellula subtilissima]|uniref:chitinase n=1 Tax=Lachnellula subtilissima TaxID=602034 RepID=A0A8H8RH71_9HELO|nr:Endochitinase [Lachnellula subtilissima]
MGGGDEYRSVAYFVNWAIYGRKYTPQMLPADKLTHVLYAFANVRPESGEVYLTDGWADTDIHFDGDSWNDSGTNLYGCLKQLNILKQQNRSLKVLLSIGGWTYSSNFAVPASSASGREKFASSAVELIKHLGFDGLDIDWEYPKNPSEASDFVLLLKACREAMDAYSVTLPHAHHFELTVACPAGAQNYEKMDIRAMDAYLDFWNLMAYDYAGSWDAKAGHQANIAPSRHPDATPFNSQSAVGYYKGQGVRGSKIVLGMPLWEPGVWDFKALPLGGAEVFWDREAGATYSYDAGKKQLVTYDTVEMAREKTRWLKNEGLGGAMWWESSGDKRGEGSLIEAVVGELGRLEKGNNCIEYPHSKYENLKNGFRG